MKPGLRLAVAALSLATTAVAQVPQCGSNVTLEQASHHRRIGGGAQEQLARGDRGSGHGGLLVAFDKLDGTQSGSVMIAQDKAVSFAMLRRPNKAIQDVGATK